MPNLHKRVEAKSERLISELKTKKAKSERLKSMRANMA